MIPVSGRLPGKLDKKELEGYQARMGIRRDGKFGAQSMHQVLLTEDAYFAEKRRADGVSEENQRLAHENTLLANKVKPKCSPWGFIAGVIASGVAWLMTQVDVLGSFFG